MAETTIKSGSVVVGGGAGIIPAIEHRELPGVCALVVHADSGHLPVTAVRDGIELVDYDNVDEVVGSKGAAAFIERKLEQYDAQFVDVGATTVQFASHQHTNSLDEATAADDVAASLKRVAEYTGATIFVGPVSPKDQGTQQPRSCAAGRGAPGRCGRGTAPGRGRTPDR
jgi:hypothetical protein